MERYSRFIFVVLTNSNDSFTIATKQSATCINLLTASNFIDVSFHHFVVTESSPREFSYVDRAQ